MENGRINRSEQINPDYSNKMKATSQRKKRLKSARQIDPLMDGSMVNKLAVKKAINWIEENNFTPIASFNREHSSYMLKHLVEAQIGQYISNESLIVAMVNCGFQGKAIVMGSSVYCFNVSRKSVNKASKGVIIF